MQTELVHPYKVEVTGSNPVSPIPHFTLLRILSHGLAPACNNSACVVSVLT
jgi:hypothetical protein